MRATNPSGLLRSHTSLPLLFGIGAALACSEPEPLCDICTTSAIVYGRVRDGAGEPVTGEPITIEVRQDTCDAAAIITTSDAGLLTDTAGSYRTRIYAGAAPFAACPRVIVGSTDGGAGQETVDGPLVDFLPDYGSSQGRDSVQVDVDVE